MFFFCQTSSYHKELYSQVVVMLLSQLPIANYLCSSVEKLKTCKCFAGHFITTAVTVRIEVE